MTSPSAKPFFPADEIHQAMSDTIELLPEDPTTASICLDSTAPVLYKCQMKPDHFSALADCLERCALVLRANPGQGDISRVIEDLQEAKRALSAWSWNTIV